MVLSIIDSWAWEEEEEAHLLALQDKFNAYLEFVESGKSGKATRMLVRVAWSSNSFHGSPHRCELISYSKRLPRFQRLSG
jgi:hypothetical protein